MTVTAAALVSRLAGENNAQRRAFAELVVDHALNLPLNTLLFADDIAAVITEALIEINATKFIDEEIHPLRERLLTHFETTGETPRDILPEGTADRLVKIVAKGDRPRAKWAKDSVDLAPIRSLVAPIVQDILLNFSRSLPIPGLGGNSDSQSSSSDRRQNGKRWGKALRKGAGSLAGMSKAAIGNFSGELERRIQATTREFSQHALRDTRHAIVDRLRSDEGQQVIRDTRIAIVERVLDTPIHVLLADLNRAPIEEIAALIPEVIEHNRTREELRTLIENEVQHHLQMRGTQPLGDILEEYHLRESIRAHVVDRLDDPIVRLIKTEAFSTWLDALLKG